MSFVTCYRIGSLLSRDPLRLTEGERLKIEAHRANCAKCRDDAGFDEALGQLASMATVQPRPSMIDRAIASAFVQPTVKPITSLSSRRLVLSVGGAALAAAAILLALSLGEQQTEPLAFVAPGPAPSEAAGTLGVGSSRSFAHATVSATSETHYEWHPNKRRLDLQRGAIRVDVTPNTGRCIHRRDAIV